MDAEEAGTVVDRNKVEDAPAKQDQSMAPEVPEQSQPKEETNGQPKKVNGEGAEKSEVQESSANGTKSALVTESESAGKTETVTYAEKSESKVHISAHERDREHQASRRVQEAQKYNSDRGARRGGFRGGRGGFKNNNRFDPSGQEQSSDPVAIRKQVFCTTGRWYEPC